MYKQSPGRMNMPKTGRGVNAATLMTGSPNKLTDPVKEGKPKKNTSGIFGGDSIMGDENKDGNIVTRGLKKLDKFLSDPTQQSTRPITKDGKLNFDAKLMDGVGTGLPKK